MMDSGVVHLGPQDIARSQVLQGPKKAKPHSHGLSHQIQSGASIYPACKYTLPACVLPATCDQSHLVQIGQINRTNENLFIFFY